MSGWDQQHDIDSWSHDSRRFVIGVDPGLSGAAALLAADGYFVDAFSFTDDGRKNKRLDAVTLTHHVRSWLDEYPVTHAIVEDVQSMPGQGVSSTFKFGRASGCVEGILAALDLAVVYVQPRVWKRQASLLGEDKDAARVQAIRRWPVYREVFASKAKGQARADAALIAATWIEYG